MACWFCPKFSSAPGASPLSLYDRLQSNDVRSIREHLRAGLDYQDKLARFLENHDEPRAASTFQWPKHPAAAAITFLSPGLRFFHQSQLEGARDRVPVQLCRGPSEPTNQEVAAFCDNAFRNGDWSQIDPPPALPDKWSSEDFVSFARAGKDEGRYVAVINYSEDRGQCYLRVPFPELEKRQLLLTDLMGSESTIVMAAIWLFAAFTSTKLPGKSPCLSFGSSARLHDKPKGDQPKVGTEQSRPPLPCRMTCESLLARGSVSVRHGGHAIMCRWGFGRDRRRQLFSDPDVA
jgi:hypothetical protein